jgi:hypothetical protein
MNTQPKPIIVQPEAGKNLHFPGGDVASIMLSGEQTGGALAVVAGTQAPDSGPPLHIHSKEDELFLIVGGNYSFFTSLSKHWNDNWSSLGYHDSIRLGAIHDPVCQRVGKPGWSRPESNG